MTMASRAKQIIPDSIREQAQATLVRLTQNLNGLQTAVLSTTDGFEIASIIANSHVSPSRLAAISSSLMAMARALGREIKYKDCSRLIFETDSGRIIFHPIPAKHPCILCLALNVNTVLGSALWTAEAIANELLTSTFAQPVSDSNT